MRRVILASLAIVLGHCGKIAAAPDAEIADATADAVTDLPVGIDASVAEASADADCGSDACTEVGPTDPGVTKVSGSCSFAAASRCDREAKCPAEDCISDCDSCYCIGSDRRCTDSVCPPAAGCPTRIPAGFSGCGGDCVCEYDSGCPGLPHRASCVEGVFRVALAPCGPRCPEKRPALLTDCWSDHLVCTYPDAAKEVIVVCQRGLWRSSPWADGSKFSRVDPLSLCPGVAPASGAFCGADTKVGEQCQYQAALTAPGQICLCQQGRFACWESGTIERPIPGLTGLPSELCVESSWCTGPGACHGCAASFGTGCRCEASGQVCGKGKGC